MSGMVIVSNISAELGCNSRLYQVYHGPFDKTPLRKMQYHALSAI